MASPIAREEITENIIAIRVSRSYSQRSGKGYEVSFSPERRSGPAFAARCGRLH